jgi:hypothetical protein
MDDVIEVVVIDGKVRCIYLNDYRIVGSKPYVSEKQHVTKLSVPNGEIRRLLKRKPRVKSS